MGKPGNIGVNEIKDVYANFDDVYIGKSLTQFGTSEPVTVRVEVEIKCNEGVTKSFI